MVVLSRSYLKYLMFLFLTTSNIFSMDSSALDVSQLIFNAVQTGDLELTQCLIEQTDNLVHLRDKQQNTLLIIACKYNFTQLAQYLIKVGSDVNNLNELSEYALFFAVANNNEDLVRLLLERRAEIFPCEQNKSLITYAREHNISQKILKMLESCAFLDIFIARDDTDIQPAITKINIEALKSLQDGSYFNSFCQTTISTSQTEQSANSLAKVVLAEKDLEEIQNLVDSGFDVNAPLDLKENRPLHYVIGTQNHELKSTRLLLSLGANPNYVNTSGKTPLHESFYSGRMAIVCELLSHGIDGTLKDKLGRNPLIDLVRQAVASPVAIKSSDELQEAILENNTTKALRCIFSGTHLNEVDSVGMRPFHWAITNQNMALARALLAHGANLSLADGAGLTPLDYCVNNNFEEITELLRSHISKSSKYLSSLKNGGTACLRMLNNRSIINSPIDDEGNYPLHLAVNFGFIPDYSKNNLSQMAQQESMNEIAKYLVLNGANVNVQNSLGQTPLLRAYMTGNRRLLKLFIAHGADANVYTPDGDNVCARLTILFQAGKW